MSKRFIIIYRVHDNLYVIATLINNVLNIREIHIHFRASRYTIEKKLFNVLKEFNLNIDTHIGLLNFINKKNNFLEILFLTKILIPFNISAFNTTKMLKRINQYHKYIRSRKVNKNKDLTYIFKKLIISKVIPWINHEINYIIENKSQNTSNAYKKVIVGLYYLQLKSKINSYKK